MTLRKENMMRQAYEMTHDHVTVILYEYVVYYILNILTIKLLAISSSTY